MAVTVDELCKPVSTGRELFVAASAVDALERFGEPWESASTVGELIVIASAVAASLLARLGELCAAASTGDEPVVFASAVGTSEVARLGGLCAAVSTVGEFVVIAGAVAGVGDVATDTLFGWYVTARITNTSTKPVNSAITPKENFFAREACAGSGGGTVLGRGGAPHEGQAVASELTSFPQS